MTSGFNTMERALLSGQAGVQELLAKLCANQDKLVNATAKLQESLQGAHSTHRKPERQRRRISALHKFGGHPKWPHFRVR